jgi:hypothetical protein
LPGVSFRSPTRVSIDPSLNQTHKPHYVGFSPAVQQCAVPSEQSPKRKECHCQSMFFPASGALVASTAAEVSARSLLAGVPLTSWVLQSHVSWASTPFLSTSRSILCNVSRRAFY